MPALIQGITQPAPARPIAIVFTALAKDFNTDNAVVSGIDIAKIIECKSRVTAGKFKGGFQRIFTAGVIKAKQSITAAAKLRRIGKPLPKQGHTHRVSGAGFGIDDIAREVDIRMAESVRGPFKAAYSREIIGSGGIALTQRRCPLGQCILRALLVNQKQAIEEVFRWAFCPAYARGEGNAQVIGMVRGGNEVVAKFLHPTIHIRRLG